MLILDPVTVYRFEEDFPFTMGILDNIAAFGVTDDESLPRAYFETGNKVVRDWMEEIYNQHKQGAVQVDPEEFGA